MSEKQADDEILELVQMVDSERDLFKRFDAFRGTMLFPTVVFSILVILIWLVLFLRELLQNILELAVGVGLLAFVVGYLRLFAPFFKENEVEVNFKRLDKKRKLGNDKKPLLKALIKMKARNREFTLKQIYDMNPSSPMFTKEKLLERLYD